MMDQTTSSEVISTVDSDPVNESVLSVSDSKSDQPTAQEKNRDAMDDHLRGAIEALLFVNERPITLDQLKRVFKTVKITDLKKIIHDIKRSWEDRCGGIQIIEIAGGYQMLTNKTYASYIRDFYKTRHSEKLSKPALETLAIMAYKQPVTRNDVEVIRGVNSDGVVNHLLNKELIKIVGRKDVAGKPYLYGTTRQFLEYFGLKSLDDLPKLEEFPQLQPDYEKTALDSEYLSEDEPSIPQDAVVMNSLEQSKQSAIQNVRKREQKNTEQQKDTNDGDTTPLQKESA